MAVLSVTPVAGENSPVDGRVGRDTAGGSWADIHDGAGSEATVINATDQISLEKKDSTDWYIIRRLILCFDTSSLTSAATISSATFTIYVDSLSGYFGTLGTAISLVGSSPASSGNLATSDYGNLGITKFATDIAVGSVAVGNITFTLNAAGLAAISKTGITYLGLRYSNDVANSPPAPSGYKNDYASFRMADYGSTEPTLAVTYTSINNYTRTLADAVLVGASRVATVERLWNTFRTLSDSIMNGASRVATLTKGYMRSLSDSVMNGASRLVSITYHLSVHFVKTLSDSIMNGADRKVILTIIAPFHSIWKSTTVTVTSWKNKIISSTTWNDKDKGQ